MNPTPLRSEQYPEILSNLEDFDQSQALAECEKFGAENGWSEEYLANIRQINQRFEDLQSLRLRHQRMQRHMDSLGALKLRAQNIAKNSEDSTRSQKSRQIINTIREQIKKNRQQLEELQDEIDSEMTAYEELVEHAIQNF